METGEEEHEIQLFSCGCVQVSFLNSVRNYQLWAARFCCCTIAVSCLCGCAVNQKEQIKMKIIFFLLLLLFYQPE